MSGKQVISFRCPATRTDGLTGDGTNYERLLSPFSIQVSKNANSDIKQFAVFEWDFSSIRLDNVADIESITSFMLTFYYKQNDSALPIGKIEFVLIESDLSLYVNSYLYAIILSSTDVFAEVTLAGDEKTQISVDLDKTIGSILDKINLNEKLTIGVRKKDSSSGQALLGGISLSQGENTPWEESNENAVIDPPTLLIKCNTVIANYPQYIMKYTTNSDPANIQTNPSNSLGGYVSLTTVNQSAQILGNVNNTQTEVFIDDSDLLPSQTSGYIQLGSDIALYNNINVDDHAITNIKRGIVSSMPVSVVASPYPQFVGYLNANALFNTSPTSQLIQHRCVAIQQQSTISSEGGTWATVNPRIFLIQNPLSNIKIDVGIEVPAWDHHKGKTASTIIGGNEITSNTESVFDSRGVINYSDGFFNSGHLVIDPFSQGVGRIDAIIDSYEYNSSTGYATFFLIDNLPNTTIPADTLFLINPAPSQVVLNEITGPTNNNGRFSGFLHEENGSSLILLEENSATMLDFDVFYLWIKRTFPKNQQAGDTAGAIIAIMGDFVTVGPAPQLVVGTFINPYLTLTFDQPIIGSFTGNEFSGCFSFVSYVGTAGLAGGTTQVIIEMTATGSCVDHNNTFSYIPGSLTNSLNVPVAAIVNQSQFFPPPP